MSTEELNAKYLDLFPQWLRDLGNDAQDLGDVIGESALIEDAQEAVVGSLNYLFKSLDLIPDGIDDIGYLDDAFVLRVGSKLALSEGELDGEKFDIVRRLADEADLVSEFLGGDFYDRLETYVVGLRNGAARGRSVRDILGEEDVRSAFLSDLRGFAKSYESPGFSREEKNLIKLRAFFDAKLPN